MFMTGKYMGTVKVGPKGQIVIPKEVRDMFSIEPGESLLLLADEEKGIAVQKYELVSKISEAILTQNKIFTDNVKKVMEEKDESD